MSFSRCENYMESGFYPKNIDSEKKVVFYYAFRNDKNLEESVNNPESQNMYILHGYEWLSDITNTQVITNGEMIVYNKTAIKVTNEGLILPVRFNRHKFARKPSLDDTFIVLYSYKKPENWQSVIENYEEKLIKIRKSWRIKRN